MTKKLTFLWGILLLLFLFSMPLLAQSKAEEQYQKGMKYMEKALSETRDSTAKKENFEAAEDAFSSIIKGKTTKDSVQAIFAQLELARIKAEGVGNKKNLTMAYEQLKQLVTRWDKDAATLERIGFTETEVREIQDKMEEIKDYKAQVAVKLDKENSHKLQYKLMDLLVRMTGRNPSFSYWFAIILIAVVIKVALTPFTNAQMRSMKEMQALQPKIKALQEKYRDNQQKLGEETMKLYKEHHVNHMSGCLPLLIQMPILFYLYACIKSYEVQFANGSFLWIGSGLTHKVAIPVFGNQSQNLWLCAGNLSEADLILLVVYIISTFFSMQLNQTPSMDPQQASQQKMMSYMFPIMFAFFFAGFPSAFLLYWFVFNVIQTIQTRIYMKKNA